MALNLFSCSPVRRGTLSLPRALFALLAVSLVAAGLSAQEPAPAPPSQPAPSASQQQIIERLRSSGLTREQVRARLQDMGRDPRLADQYFDAIERGVTPTAEPSGDFMEAMQRIGVMLRDQVPSMADTLIRLDGEAGRGPSGELPIFGRSLFRIATSQFQPVSTGPVDPDYRLGPGDQVVAVLTGDVELTHTLEVSREGLIAIPDVGMVYVAGMTVRELEDRLYERLGRVYSGVGRGAGASTQLSLSMGQLRSNQVFLMGEVERPGAYQVSSVATVFNALYQGRGPSANGSFRRIELRRNGRTIRTIDVYDYLLRGDSRDDVRLEQGDIIFVPLVGRQVDVQGAVRREARFELKEGESLRDALVFAGGLQAGASIARVQIDRILPPSQRSPGIDRVLVDVDLTRVLRGDGSIALSDQDRVMVFPVTGERRNRLVVSGEVRRPGMFEYRQGMSLWQLIDRAEGLNEQAYTARAHVYRVNREDGTRTLVQAPLYQDDGGRRDLSLEDQDSIVIFSRATLRPREEARIAGFVKAPRDFALAEGMTVRDAILAAGGFERGADERIAEVSRLPDPGQRTSRIAVIYQVPIGGIESNAGTMPTGGPSPAAEFPLQHGDVIYIRRAPGYEPSRLVRVTGQVMTPGVYALETRQERLSDVIRRAGGLTPEAYTRGIRLYRDHRLVASDLTTALRNPRSRANLTMEAGDSLHVPEYDGTVLVTGAVTFETRVPYQPGLSLGGYISRAGGFGPNAYKSRVSVTHPDGERHTVNRVLLFSSSPSVPPGSVVYVPQLPADSRTNWGEVLTQVVSAITGAATLFLAVDRISR